MVLFGFGVRGLLIGRGVFGLLLSLELLEAFGFF